jgi:hypothetical protein
MRRLAILTNMSNASLVSLCGILVPLVANGATLSQTSVSIIDSRRSVIELPVDDDPGTAAERTDTTVPHSSDEGAYQFLMKTARPGGTMARQGREVAIRRLHPEFAMRLVGAIREARELGLTEAGIFSAYRPPAWGVGGFNDKFNSLHSYGLAVDMHGIGGPGSAQAKLWHSIAANHGVACPYGFDNRAEWNHCQPTRVKVVRSDNPLRKTISANGPQDPFNMFEAGRALIESVANLFKSFDVRPQARVEQSYGAPSVGAFSFARAGNRIAARGSSRTKGNLVPKSLDSAKLAAEGGRAVARVSRLAGRVRFVDLSPSSRSRHVTAIPKRGHGKKSTRIAAGPSSIRHVTPPSRYHSA